MPQDSRDPNVEGHPTAPAAEAASPSPDPPESPATRTVSAELEFLIGQFHEHPVRLREVIEVMHGRAWTMLLVLLALPFCTPITLPGLSTPFGLVIALIGFRLSLGQKPWLPRRLLEMQLPPRFFSRLLGAARRLVRFLEFFLKPRMTWLLDLQTLHHAYGAMILAGGVLLLLPLPIPFTNTLPALTVVLVAGAMLERDGRAALVGTGMFFLTLCFFGALAFGGTEMVHWLRERLGGHFLAD